MERTITINMGQRIFVINEDAYYMLKDYLTTLRQVFAGNNSSDEIISDIESSISDIFAEKYGTEPTRQAEISYAVFCLKKKNRSM